MNYNTSTTTLSKNKPKNIPFSHNGIYNCSFLGNKCHLFDELDKLSKEIDDGSFVELDL